MGAQKSGTTWLHSYINSFECADFGMLKEYHVWDAITSPLCKEFVVTHEYINQENRSIAFLNDADMLRYAMQQSKGVYEDYFINILRQDGINITGDITPSYACLTEETLMHIKTIFNNANVDVKVVFLMRDPFERCWSAIRMYKKHMIEPIQTDSEMLKSLYCTDHFEFRTNYPETIRRIEKVFDPKNIYFGVFESLTRRSEMIRLSKFIGVDINDDHAKLILNASPKFEEYDPELKKEICNHYRHVYKYCNDRFPDTSLLWHAV